MELTINRDNFKNEVIDSDKLILLDFWAMWCDPCRMLSPMIAEIAESYPEIKVGKVNVDDGPELAATFGVSSIPMLAVMKSGRVTHHAVGYMPKEKMEEMLK